MSFQYFAIYKCLFLIFLYKHQKYDIGVAEYMDIIKNYTIHLKGISPLIMCADTLCDPLHPDKKRLSELTSLKKKTDDHHKLIDKIIWQLAYAMMRNWEYIYLLNGYVPQFRMEQRRTEMGV